MFEKVHFGMKSLILKFDVNKYNCNLLRVFGSSRVERVRLLTNDLKDDFYKLIFLWPLCLSVIKGENY